MAKKTKSVQRTSSRPTASSPRDDEAWDDRVEEPQSERRATTTTRKKARKKITRSESDRPSGDPASDEASRARTAGRARTRTGSDEPGPGASRPRPVERSRASRDSGDDAEPRASRATTKVPAIRKKKKKKVLATGTEATTPRPADEDERTSRRKRTGPARTATSRTATSRTATSRTATSRTATSRTAQEARASRDGRDTGARKEEPDRGAASKKKTESSRTASPRTESSRTESSRTASPRTESSRTASPRTESSRTASPRTESSRTASPRTESSRTASPRTESSRTASPRTESSRTASPRTESSRTRDARGDDRRSPPPLRSRQDRPDGAERGGRSDRAGRRSRDRSSPAPASRAPAPRTPAPRAADRKPSVPPRSVRPPVPARPGVETGDSKDLAKRKYAPGEGKSDRRILISTRDDQESRVCVIAENRLEELYIDKVGDNTFLGNVYLGKVVNLEPSIGAAFIDFGEGKNGFLHASDVIPCVQENRIKDFLALSEEGANGTAAAAATGARRTDERKNIDELLNLGDELVVQVTKDGIGHKGPTLTTYISIPGCYLVLMPNLRRTGVSRKIADSEERRRLREILRGLELPEGLGFIIRTAGEDHPRQDLERDAQFLMKMWTLICRRLKGARAPASLYRETDLILRSLRDLFTPDTVAVVVDSERHFRRCLDFMKNVMPHYSDRVKLHDRPKPLFTQYNLDAEVEKVFNRKVHLSSGATIVFDQAEALVAIDVNSGKNKEESDLEETALKTNLNAIPDIVRQLRLRDLGGVVIIDFIDMIEERHRRRVERALRDELRKDRARFRMEGMSMFGIIELTRQRVRPSLFVAASATCPACGGLGSVKSAESVSHTILRRLRGEMARQHCSEIEVRLHPRMAAYFQNTRRAALLQMEETFNKVIRITPEAMLRYEDLRLAYHERPRDLGAELEHYF